MFRLLLALTCLLLLPHFPCNAADHAPAEEPLYLADAGGQQSTELMQQSDHQNRVKKKKEDREVEKQMAAVGASQTENRGLDNFVMIVLAISAGALILLSGKISRRKRRRPRRQPLR